MKTLLRFLLGIAVVLAGCGTSSAARHVIHISVDGLRSDHLQELVDANQLPNFQRLVREGASTYNARTDYDYTVTLPNHTSMLTGRPVLQPSGQPDTVPHGYTRNSTPPAGVTLHTSNPSVPYIASVFDVAHDHGLSTALFASKNKFILYNQSYGDKIDFTAIKEAARADDGTLVMHHAFVAAMDSVQFDYVFLHYRDPDSAGHDFGWGSERWNESVRRVDGYVGDLLALIQRNQELRDRTTIILSADHGGKGEDHDDAGERHIHTIPFIVWGPRVAAGADLYALNPLTRADPDRSRPDYNATPQPIRNGDGGNLALMLLGLGPIPGSTINARQDLLVTKEKP
jgi:hypothetical protein